MFITRRLFDEDSHLFDFSASVLTCVPGRDAGTYAVTLDRTAFFPEGGGQGFDPGTLGGAHVLDVQSDKQGLITHTVDAPLTVGSTVEGHLDAAVRTERMQCHSAEHIVSGIIHRRFGYDNVGFHLGGDDVTLDFNGLLDRAQLDEIEDEANRIVRACVPIVTGYPAADILAGLTYRSKLDLTEDVRIVRVGEAGEYDICACCAPHVKQTGEIGLVKLLEFIHYKGGVRIHLSAGIRALRDYRERYTATARIAAAMSVRQSEVLSGFERMSAQVEADKTVIAGLRRELQNLKIAALPATDGNLVLFEDGADALAMRQLLNRAVDKCGGICGVFSGSDAAGYTYVIGRARADIDLRQYANAIRSSLNAKGGGSAEMLQGRTGADRETIQRFFDNLTI